MKLQGNQAFANFLAIATISTTTNDKNAFVSARIGGTSSSSSSQKQHLRKAPTKKGFDPTAPVDESDTVGVEFTQPLRNKKVVVPEEPSRQYRFQQRRRSSSSDDVADILNWLRNSGDTSLDPSGDFAKLDSILPKNPEQTLENRANSIKEALRWMRDQDYEHYERPAAQSIDDATLNMQEGEQENRIRNATTNSSNNVPMNDGTDCYNDLDTGVLICESSSSAADSSSGTPSGTPSRTAPSSDATLTSPTTKTTKLIDLPNEDEDEPVHDIQCRIKHLHDVDLKLMTADQFLSEMEMDGAYYGIAFDARTQTVVCDDCQNLVFEHCNLKCNGETSCYNARIHDADKVECNGEESCFGAHIDSHHVSCNAERACHVAYIGDNQFTYTLDCLAHESCSWATTSQVNDVNCIGPAACYGAYLGGVNSQVTCQSLYTLKHGEGHYSPTCGGDKGFIEAAEDKSINVLCNGDFSCIGYGHDPYDESVEHPIYFDVDVGRKGELVCEGSLVGNHDGGTYVCRYIDIIQGCGNYECHEPTGFNEVNDYRTCNHIFSIHHHELCYEGPGGHVVADDDDDDDVDEDEDDDEDEVEDDEDYDISIAATTTNDVPDDSQEMTQHFYTSTVKLIYDPYGEIDEDDDDDEVFTDDDEYVIDEVGLIEVPAEMMRDLFRHHVVNKVI